MTPPNLIGGAGDKAKFRRINSLDAVLERDLDFSGGGMRYCDIFSYLENNA
jgi:hypothetical protein